MTVDLDVEREIQRFDQSYRRTHLGASEWSAACGLSPYTAPIDLWARHVGEADEQGATPASDLGHDMEDGIIRNAARRLGFAVLPQRTIEHPSLRFMCATPDCPTLEPIQAKMSGFAGHASTIDWGEEGTDEVPEHVIAQVQGEMFVARATRLATCDAFSGPDRTHVAALLPGREHGVALFVVEYDAELAEMLAERVCEFWRHVEDRTPPPADASESYLRHLAAKYPTPSKGRWVESDARLDAHALELRMAKEAMASAKKSASLARNCLAEAIGDAYGIRGPWGQACFYGVKGKKSLDTELLTARLGKILGPEKTSALVDECTKTGIGYRAFKATFKDSNNNGDDE